MACVFQAKMLLAQIASGAHSERLLTADASPMPPRKAHIVMAQLPCTYPATHPIAPATGMMTILQCMAGPLRFARIRGAEDTRATSPSPRPSSSHQPLREDLPHEVHRNSFLSLGLRLLRGRRGGIHTLRSRGTMCEAGLCLES